MDGLAAIQPELLRSARQAAWTSGLVCCYQARFPGDAVPADRGDSIVSWRKDGLTCFLSDLLPLAASGSVFPNLTQIARTGESHADA